MHNVCMGSKQMCRLTSKQPCIFFNMHMRNKSSREFKMVVTNIQRKKLVFFFFFNQLKHITKDLFEFLNESGFIFNIFYARNNPPEKI